VGTDPSGVPGTDASQGLLRNIHGPASLTRVFQRNEHSAREERCERLVELGRLPWIEPLFYRRHDGIGHERQGDDDEDPDEDLIHG
jgi:hypothetical protein